jgi:MATE family multidrug resistance protein
LLKIGVPSGIQIVAEVLAWSLFSIFVMASFGTSTMAANTFMFRYMAVSFMPAFGISMAVTALVGRYLGMGREDVARQRADLGFVIAATAMLSCGLLFFLGRNVLMGLFTHDPETLRIGAMLLVFAAVYQFFDAMYIIYNGALRGAGDTLVPALTTAGLCWGMTVFGGYLIARWKPQWGPAGPWSIGSLYGMILGTFMLLRFRRGRWKAVEHTASDSSSSFEISPTPLASATLSPSNGNAS